MLINVPCTNIIIQHDRNAYALITASIFPPHTQPAAHLAMYLFSKTPEQGAQTSIYCATAPEVEGQQGTFWDSCAMKKLTKKGVNDEESKRLWDYSVEQLGL